MLRAGREPTHTGDANEQRLQQSGSTRTQVVPHHQTARERRECLCTRTCTCAVCHLYVLLLNLTSTYASDTVLHECILHPSLRCQRVLEHCDEESFTRWPLIAELCSAVRAKWLSMQRSAEAAAAAAATAAEAPNTQANQHEMPVGTSGILMNTSEQYNAIKSLLMHRSSFSK